HTHPPASAAARERFRSELTQGLRAVRERPVLIRITAATGISNFGLAAQQAVLLLFVYRGLHLHPLAAGVALGLGAAGNVAGAALRMVGIGTCPLGALAGGAAGGVLASSLGAAHGYALTLALASLVAASSGAVLLPRRVRELRV